MGAGLGRYTRLFFNQAMEVSDVITERSLPYVKGFRFQDKTNATITATVYYNTRPGIKRIDTDLRYLRTHPKSRNPRGGGGGCLPPQPMV